MKKVYSQSILFLQKLFLFSCSYTRICNPLTSIHIETGSAEEISHSTV